jgi:hypothetical protein
MWFKNFFGISTTRQSLRGASTITLSVETLEQRETPSGGLTFKRELAVPTFTASTVATFQVAPVSQTVDYGALRW